MYNTIFMSCGNPDLRQNPDLQLPGVPLLEVKEKTLERIREKWMQWIVDNNLGGGNTIPTIIFDSEGNPVARISYNGRLWDCTTGCEL